MQATPLKTTQIHATISVSLRRVKPTSLENMPMALQHGIGEGPPCLRESDVLSCQFQEWYPQFRHVSLASEVIPLPEDFVEYLLEDGVFLPPGSEALPRRRRGGEWESHRDDYEEWDETEDDDPEPTIPSFSELDESMRAAICRLGGSVLPKLNWSCPKDVGWLIPSGSAKCQNPGEVLLLLKSSDSLVHDLTQAFEGCVDKTLSRPPQVVLVLRRWFSLKPEMEFRCFVRGGRLIGICQREVTNRYSVLEERRGEVQCLVEEFLQDEVVGKFGLHNYTVDVYVSPKNRVKVIDLNPWGAATLPLLFTWEELEEIYQSRGVTHDFRVDCESFGTHRKDSGAVERNDGIDSNRQNGANGETVCHESGREVVFRVVEEGGGVQLGMRAASGVPLDLFHRGEGGPIDKMIKKLREEDNEE